MFTLAWGFGSRDKGRTFKTGIRKKYFTERLVNLKVADKCLNLFGKSISILREDWKGWVCFSLLGPERGIQNYEGHRQGRW